MTNIRYQVTTYGEGFHGPGHRALSVAMGILRVRMRSLKGPFTVDDPERPNDGHVERHRQETLAQVRKRIRPAQPGLKLVVRGSHYDQRGLAIRKVDLEGPHPLIDHARVYLNNPYLLGAIPPPKADCSGLTLKVVQEVYGYLLPHQALQQATDPHMRTFHDPSELSPDDFIFYVYGRLGGEIDHVALFTGPGKEIGARPSAGGVAVTPIDWPNVKQFGRLKK